MNQLNHDILEFNGDGRGENPGKGYIERNGSGETATYVDCEYEDGDGEGCGWGLQNGHGFHGESGCGKGLNPYHQSIGERE